MPAFDYGSFGPAFDLFADSSVASRGFTYASIPKRDHKTEASDRLYQQFKDKPNLKALIDIFSARYDGLEAAFYALLTERTIYTAIGAQLDQIGKIVGQPRLGFDDETYRRYILARVAANKSDGLVSDLIDITRFVLNNSAQTVQVVNAGIATAITKVTGNRVEWETAVIIADLLRVSVSAGVRMLLEFETWPATVITKTSGTTGLTTDSGCSSNETIGGDGWVQTKIVDLEGNGAATTTGKIIGLSTTYASINLNNIQYAFYALPDGSLKIYELGVQKFFIAAYAVNDVLRIERVGSTVTFKRNGTAVYTSVTPSTGALKACVSLENISTVTGRKSTWVDVRVYSAGLRQLITWGGQTNVTLSSNTAAQPTVQTFASRGRFADSRIFEAGAGGYPQTAAQMKTAAAGFGNWVVGWAFDALSGNFPPIFGSPTLTFSFSNTNMGPKYACPGFRGFSDKSVELIPGGANVWDGGNNYALTVNDDLAILFVAYQPAFAVSTPSRPLIAKGDQTVGQGGTWNLRFNNSGQFFLRLVTNAGVAQDVGVSPHPVGKFYVGLAAYDRAAGKTGVGVRALDGSVESLSSELTIPGGEAYATNTNLLFGNYAGVEPPERVIVSQMYLAHGSGGAAGMTTNMSRILVSFCNYVNSWPYLRNAAIPTYGNGFEDANDKLGSGLNGLRSMLRAGTTIDVGNQAGMTLYPLNEASGNATSAFGTPGTLTVTGSPTYGLPGPRGVGDKAIAFPAPSTDFFDGGSNFDVTTIDLFTGCAFLAQSALLTNAVWFSKASAALADGWAVCTNNNDVALMAQVNGGAQFASRFAFSQLTLGQWYALLAYIDRTTNVLRVGVQNLVTGVQILGTSVTPGTSNFTTAATFRIGKSTWISTDPNVRFSEVFASTGTNVALIGTDFSNVLSRFATSFSRPYGGALSAAME